MTIDQLKDAGLFKFGAHFECVDVPHEWGIKMFTVGKVYEVVLSEDGLALECDDYYPQRDSLSRFVPTDPFEGDAVDLPDIDFTPDLDFTPDGSIISAPPHYTKWKIQPITFIMENNLPFDTGNIIKYVMRAGLKIYDGMDARESEITDLTKARRYIDMKLDALR